MFTFHFHLSLYYVILYVMKNRRLFTRKLFLLLFLAAAGILVGEVYQHFSVQSSEEVLANYHATLLVERTLYINGVPVVAKVWDLPAHVSTNVLAKAKGRSLITHHGDKRIVFTFNEELPQNTVASLPEVFPSLPGVEWETIVDLTNNVVALGHSTRSLEALRAEANAAAVAAQWKPAGNDYWVKDDTFLLLALRETDTDSRVHFVWGRKQ